MLSPHMQKYLESLTALHSADLQAQGTRDLGRTVRREPVTTEHPLIRTNPVTGWKSIFFNPGFVTKIVGIPKTESDHVIALLNEIVATSPEIHVRFQWGEGDVALWDNRSTVCFIPLLVLKRGMVADWCFKESLRFVWLCAAPSARGSCRGAGRETVSGPKQRVAGRGSQREVWDTKGQ